MLETLESTHTDFSQYFSVDGFEVSSLDNSQSTGKAGSVEIFGTSPEGTFAISFTRGYTPPGPIPGSEADYEPDTIYVDDLNVDKKLQSKGIGYMLRCRLLDLAVAEGAIAIRSHAQHPNVIAITEKMYREGKISEKPRYKIKLGEGWVAEPATLELLSHPSEASAEEATNAIKQQKASVVNVIKV